MKYIKQFCLILLISFIGEALNFIIPAPIPASIYGLVILFLCLVFKVIPIEAVKDTGMFLVEIMPMLFVPAAAGLIDSWANVKDSFLLYVVIIVLTTAIVMIVSGHVTQFVIRRKKND